MFFWFIGTAILTVGLVFRDPRFDYRLLIIGAVIPLGDGLFGGARALHGVTVSVILLGLLVLATTRGGSKRKMLLGLPIGMILHLVFDGVWGSTRVFWWPFFGVDFDGAPLPVGSRGWWALPFEFVGIAICVWIWRNNELGTKSARQAFVRDGYLNAVPQRLA